MSKTQVEGKEAEDEEAEDQEAAKDQVVEGKKGQTTKMTRFSQSIATVIAFAFEQRKRHPDLPKVFIPTIQVSPANFVVILYNPETDDLVCRNYAWGKATLIMLWVVLHYRLFSASIASNFPSNFKSLVHREPFKHSLYCAASGDFEPNLSTSSLVMPLVVDACKIAKV